MVEMNSSQPNTPSQNTDFQLGLLNFAHLLMAADGTIDQREKVAIRKIKLEERIPDWIFDDFEESIYDKTERQIYEEAVKMLNRCSEEEKLRVFAHLYRLSEADDRVHVREVRLLLYSLKATNVPFEEVERRAAAARTETPRGLQQNTFQ
jgi:uncharacterized tellurite resistance protein B-like protein